jgi:hypothetical protein
MDKGPSKPLMYAFSVAFPSSPEVGFIKFHLTVHEDMGIGGVSQESA